MKKILPVLALLMASCASVPAPAPSVVEAKPAPPAAPREVTYEEALPVSIRSYYSNGDPSGTVTFQYTAQGLLVRQETFNGNGVLVEVRTGKAKGDLWRISTVNALTGEVKGHEERTLGGRGELLVQTFLNEKEAVQASNEYTYNEAGQKTQWLAKTGTGGLQGRTVYQYDSQGNNVRTEVYDAGGRLGNLFESTFDNKGQILTRKGYDAASTLVEQTAYTWKDGRKVKEESTKPFLRTIEYAYGDKAAPTSIVHSARGKVSERQTLEYQWFTKTRLLAP